MNWLLDDDRLVNRDTDGYRVWFGNMDGLVDGIRIGLGHLNWIRYRVWLGYWNRLEDRNWMVFDDGNWDSNGFRHWNRYWFRNRYWFWDRNDLLDSLVDGNLDGNVDWMRD